MRQTNDRRAATDTLRELAAGFRIRPDAEGWPVIPGRFGRIEYYDGQFLAVFTDRRRLHSKLLAIPGVCRHQAGDDEMRALFDPAALAQVARVIRAKRKRALSPEQARALGSKTAYRATSAA